MFEPIRIVSTVFHVIPTDDLIEHEDEGDGCPCGPTWKFLPGGGYLVHHSLDGREKKE